MCALCWVDPRPGRTLRAHCISDSHALRATRRYVRYQGGVDTQLNALDADHDLFQAELTLAQTRYSELASVVQLYKALGGGWQVAAQ